MDIKFNKEKGQANVYGSSMLFHCNHYNRSLQMSIEDADFIDSEKILVNSAAETSYLQMKQYYSENPGMSFSDKLNFAAKMFAFAGFGKLDFSGVNDNGGIVKQASSHYGMALKLTVLNRTNPGEYFDKGFIIGSLIAASEESDNAISKGFTLKATKSISLDQDSSEFEIDLNEKTEYLEMLEKNELPDFVEIPGIKNPGNINKDAIVTALAGMDLSGNDDGLIPAFGVYLTRMYADYYNKISFRFEKEIVKNSDVHDFAQILLTEAGHICGFNTMGGIMNSDEWYAMIKPMFQTKEDWMYGIIACIDALGWGVWRVEELIPNEKMVIRVYEAYESLGHLQWFGKSKFNNDYLVTGVSAALMNLIYLGDASTKPVYDKAYYASLFMNEYCFKGQQTKCLAAGDDYSEIVVTG